MTLQLDSFRLSENLTFFRSPASSTAFVSSPTRPFYIPVKMLRRQLLRQSRAICNPGTILHQKQSLSFSQFRQHTTPRHSSAFPPRIWQRYQSTEVTKEGTDPNPVAPGQTPQDTNKASEPTAENPLQKDLDAKSKEVITLKVCYALSFLNQRRIPR